MLKIMLKTELYTLLRYDGDSEDDWSFHFDKVEALECLRKTKCFGPFTEAEIGCMVKQFSKVKPKPKSDQIAVYDIRDTTYYRRPRGKWMGPKNSYAVTSFHAPAAIKYTELEQRLSPYRIWLEEQNSKGRDI